MKRFMITTAVAAILATPLLAQETTDPMEQNQTGTGDTPGVGAMGEPGALTDAPGAVPAIAMPEGMIPADPSMVSPDNLAGATVYDADAGRVASVSEVIIGTNGEMSAILIDIGGFLGIGSRTVELRLEDVALAAEADRPEAISVFVPMTEAQLDTLPEVES